MHGQKNIKLHTKGFIMFDSKTLHPPDDDLTEGAFSFSDR